MRSITRLIAAAALISSAGCGGIIGRGGSPTARALYSVSTNQDIYRRGNTGEATIRNVSGQSLQYNLCQRRLERQVNKYWVVAYEWPTAGGACTTEARTLAKDGTITTLFELPTGVPSGMYRVVFNGLLDRKGAAITPEQSATKLFEVR